MLVSIKQRQGTHKTNEINRQSLDKKIHEVGHVLSNIYSIFEKSKGESILKFRTILRDDNKQLQMEKKGAVVIPFLFPDNISWLHQKQKEIGPVHDANQIIQVHEILNEKLQSKVEYRCINCSPFQIYYREFSDYTNRQRSFFIPDSITNEERSSALHLIAPLLKETDEGVTFHYLAGSHLMQIPHRGKDIPMFYEVEGDFVRNNFSTLKVKSGEAFLIFGNVPYNVIPDNRSISLLEIIILPYEARPTIYELDKESDGGMLKRYELDLEAYILYKSGMDEALQKMKELRKISFTPLYLTSKEKEALVLKSPFKSLILENRFFNKIFTR